ncbi:MAG: hypothetical protein MI922_10070 [Bacteroidales bacterium]|nr:hypothetical protein [Bacteroidales bacterium]
MKKLEIIVFTACMIVLGISCDDNNEKTPGPIEIKKGTISLGECNTYLHAKSILPPIANAVLKGTPGGYLIIEANETELCCGADSITIKDKSLGNDLIYEIIDHGPHTHCYCNRNISFQIGPFETNKTYNLRLIESDHSYHRDTITIEFTYTPEIDTLVYAKENFIMLSKDPLQHQHSVLGGCNTNDPKFLDYASDYEKDTVIFTEKGNNLEIFTGINLPCCFQLTSIIEIDNDTLLLHLNTTNDDGCNCICYYTNLFSFSNYLKQRFYYKVLFDGDIVFQGSHNM